MFTYKVMLRQLTNGEAKISIVVTSNEDDAMAIAEMNNQGYKRVFALLAFKGSPGD